MVEKEGLVFIGPPGQAIRYKKICINLGTNSFLILQV